MDQAINRDSGYLDNLSGLVSGAGDLFESALGWYGQWATIQRAKDASGIAQLENNDRPYITSNVQTQALSGDQLAASAGIQTGAQTNSEMASDSWIPGVSNQVVVISALAALVLFKVAR